MRGTPPGRPFGFRAPFAAGFHARTGGSFRLFPSGHFRLDHPASGVERLAEPLVPAVGQPLDHDADVAHAGRLDPVSGLHEG